MLENNFKNHKDFENWDIVFRENALEWMLPLLSGGVKTEILRCSEIKIAVKAKSIGQVLLSSLWYHMDQTCFLRFN